MEENILMNIAEEAKRRVALEKKKISLPLMRRMAEKRTAAAAEGVSGSGEGGQGPLPFEQALSGEDIAFICEVKKASPSRGLIAESFPYLDIARSYEEAGAAAISVLTEPRWFRGNDAFLQDIARAVNIPCLRKDFVVDEYMIWQARMLEASAVLLIVSLLEEGQLKEYISICRGLGMSALVEAHDENEIGTAVRAGARVIGVNNRNLKDFSVDLNNSVRLRSLVPSDILFVAESGIHTPEDVDVLRRAGVNGVLIGEALMRAEDRKAMLQTLRGDRG